MKKADEILDVLLNGTEYAPVVFTIDEGEFITRVRPGWGYNEPKQLSYPQDAKNVGIQRANIKGYPVFYGAMSDDNNHLENTRYIAVAESSELLTNKESGVERFTCGRWRTVRPLLAVSFIMNETYPELEEGLIAYFKNHYMCKTNLTNKQREAMSILNGEFAKMVAKGHEEEYAITANVCHKILHERTYRGMPVDAVIYPSVKTGGQAGVNIAIHPVAANTLYLDRVLEVELLVNGMSAHLENVKGMDGMFNEVKI